MKKKLKYIENKIIKLLDKKITLASVIWIILFLITISIIIKSIKTEYSYIDMVDSTGVSTKCYYDDSSRDLRCLIPVQVKQYYKR